MTEAEAPEGLELVGEHSVRGEKEKDTSADAVLTWHSHSDHWLSDSFLIMLNIAKEHRCMQRLRVQSNRYRMTGLPSHPSPRLVMYDVCQDKTDPGSGCLERLVFYFSGLAFLGEYMSVGVDEGRERYMRRMNQIGAKDVKDA